jgi:hypothetical protein
MKTQYVWMVWYENCMTSLPFHTFLPGPPGRPIYGPEALLHNIELPKKKQDFQRASCFPITFSQWRPDQPSMLTAKVQKPQVSP